MFFSQALDLAPWRAALTFLTEVALGYIMIEVGKEFNINKKQWQSYLKDYGISSLAALLPWIFCFVYMLFLMREDIWQETLLISLFAAPTSSGILFSMLLAAGLGTTWLFRKVQILAIFDDLNTILILIPMQFLLSEIDFGLLYIVVLIIILLVLAWIFLHRLKIPSSRLWMFAYSIILVYLLHLLASQFDVEIGVILPAFVLGCMLYNKDNHSMKEFQSFDNTIKVLFMILVGLALPKINLNQFNGWKLAFDVVIITILSNLGKCAPMFFYKNEASLKERIAVSIGMFPEAK